MGMHHYACFGHFIPLEDVIQKIDCQEEWEQIRENVEVLLSGDDFCQAIKGTNIEQKFAELFPNGYDFVYIDDEADTIGSQMVENETMYIGLATSDLYHMTPNETYKKLESIGLTPVQDSFCAFG